MPRLCGQLSKNAVHTSLISVRSVSSRPSEFVLIRKLSKTGLHENASPFFAFLELRNCSEQFLRDPFFLKNI